MGLMRNKSLEVFSKLKTHKSIDTEKEMTSKCSITNNNEPKLKKGHIKLREEETELKRILKQISELRQ
jgi:hypothetical protein